jgi:hypothetical protein
MATNTPFTRDSEGKIILNEIPEAGPLGIYSNISMKELIEERLGYSFKLEEIPPKLRARLLKLENDWPDLIEKNSSYHKFEEELLRQKREVEAKIKDIDHELENPPKVKLSLGCGTLSIVAGIFFLITAALLIGGPGWSTSIGLSVLAAILIILPVITFISRKKEYKEDLLEEKSKALKSLDENKKLEKEQEPVLKSHKEEIISLIKNFNKDLVSLSNDINDSLNAIFQGKMDFGLIRSTMKTKGLIIEKIECPFCGGDIVLPETGHVTKCEHCGRNVYAADILKELEKR